MKALKTMIPASIVIFILVIACKENKQLKEFDAFANKKITDTLITQAVEDEISYHPEVPSHRIDVSTKDGIVLLSGSTENLLAQKRATEIAERV